MELWNIKGIKRSLCIEEMGKKDRKIISSLKKIMEPRQKSTHFCEELLSYGAS